MWGITAAIIAVAVLGKLAGAAFTARITGMNWKDSLGLGVLMNTRGLVELVILNAGLDLGIVVASTFQYAGAYGSGHNFHDHTAPDRDEN